MTPSHTQDSRHRIDTATAQADALSPMRDRLPPTAAFSPGTGRTRERTLRPVVKSELLQIIAALIGGPNVHASEPDNWPRECLWRSPCGEVTLEAREPQHDELRFFIQDPDDFYVEYLLSYRNFLVFAHRDRVWTHIESSTRTSAASEVELPAACWRILSQAARERKRSGHCIESALDTQINGPASRPAMAQLLRAG